MTVLSTAPLFIKEKLVGSSAKVDGNSVLVGAHLSGIEKIQRQILAQGLDVDVSVSNAVMVRLNTQSPEQAQQLHSMVQADASIIGVPKMAQRQKQDGSNQLVLEFNYPEFLLGQMGRTLTPSAASGLSYAGQADPPAQAAPQPKPDRSMLVDEQSIDIGDINLDDL